MDPHVELLDLSVAARDQWEKMTDESRMFWINYFQLKPLQNDLLRSLTQYAHEYSYGLQDADVARVVFCAVVEMLRYNRTHQMRRAFVGNSGGLDSATVCALLSKAFVLSRDVGETFDVLSFGLPIHSNPDHDARARETAQAFAIRHKTIKELDDVFHSFQRVLSPLATELNFTEDEQRRSLGNVKARMRMIVNFFATTQSGSYVISTDNLSELYMAFWTLMGDVGTFGPIQSILKGLELPAIAYALGIPERTLHAKPTDGLGVHTSLDQDEGGDIDAFHGIRYPDLDAIICYATSAGLDLSVADPVPVDASRIHSPIATQKIVDSLIAQMASPVSVWKRTKGSIGTVISRTQLGLPSLSDVAAVL